MKKILFVHQVSTIGGGSFGLLNLLKAIDRDQFEPIALLKDKGPLVGEIEKLGIEVRLMPSMDVAPYNRSFRRPGTWVTYASAFFSRFKFRKELKASRPDIIYFNNSMLWPYLRIAKQMNMSTVIHIREHWPLNEHTYQLGWLRKSIYKYADKVIAINKYSASMVPDVDVNLVYDWIDFSERYIEHPFNDIFQEDVSNKKVYLYTGGMQAIKGCREVLTAFSRLSDNDSRLLALGVDYSQSEIAQIIRNDKRIVCMKSTYAIKDLMEKCYAVLSYFTIPHANLALAEAIILQTPIIAANTEEAYEYSNEGQLAILFNINDMAEFEDKLSSFDYYRDDLKKRLRKDSYLIADIFDKERNINVFRSILNNIN